MKLAAWAASSANPEDVSNRVKGIVLALSGVIIFIAAQFFNVTLAPDDVAEFASQLSVIAGLAWALWGALLALVRKIASL